MPLTQVPSGMLQTTAQYYGFKNRIINGAMVIAQRGTSFVQTGTSFASNYILDRFYTETTNTTAASTWSQSTDVPAGAGFQYSLLQTVTATQASIPSTGQYYGLAQIIEGYNFYDLMYGTSYAKSSVLSFWVKSSVTGTFCGTLCQQSGTTLRSYPFTYTISAASTWQQVMINITGDTTANAIPTTNGGAIKLELYSMLSSGFANGTANTWNANGSTNSYTSSVGVNLFATSGATWQITGVQLEVGAQATSFDYRPYGTEFSLCQRYYQLVSAFNGGGNTTTQVAVNFPFQTAMRAAPTLSVQGPIQISDSTADYLQSSANITGLNFNITSAVCFLANFTGLTVTRVCFGPRLAANNNTITLSAEL